MVMIPTLLTCVCGCTPVKKVAGGTRISERPWWCRNCGLTSVGAPSDYHRAVNWNKRVEEERARRAKAKR
jgi:hypothetical protein